MKRDDDYLRDLLFELERDDRAVVLVTQVIAPSADEQKKKYHIELLSDVGFVVSVSNSAYRMTMQGHDYLDAIRSDPIWKKTKDGAAQIGGATLGVMKDLAVAYIKQEAAEKLGINL